MTFSRPEFCNSSRPLILTATAACFQSLGSPRFHVTLDYTFTRVTGQRT